MHTIIFFSFFFHIDVYFKFRQKKKDGTSKGCPVAKGSCQRPPLRPLFLCLSLSPPCFRYGGDKAVVGEERAT